MFSYGARCDRGFAIGYPSVDPNNCDYPCECRSPAYNYQNVDDGCLDRGNTVACLPLEGEVSNDSYPERPPASYGSGDFTSTSVGAGGGKNRFYGKTISRRCLRRWYPEQCAGDCADGQRHSHPERKRPRQ